MNIKTKIQNLSEEDVVRFLYKWKAYNRNNARLIIWNPITWIAILIVGCGAFWDCMQLTCKSVTWKVK